jgi:hypothetical protein
MGKVTVGTGRLGAAASAALTLTGAGRGPARTRTVNMMLVAAALAAGLTVTACGPTSTPAAQGGGSGANAPAGQGGAGAAAPAGQAGDDPGCQAIASQLSTISSQLSATSGNYSAQVPVLQEWYNDLQSAQQDAQSTVVAGALGDVGSGVENIIVDEQNLMDDPNIGFSQLDSDDSSYASEVSNLETVCGFGS